MSSEPCEQPAPSVTVAEPATRGSPARRRPRLLWLLMVAAALLFCAPPMLLLLWTRNNQRQVEAELALIELAGEPLTPRELGEFSRLRDGAENVAPLVLSAAAVFEGEAFARAAAALPIVGGGAAPLPLQEWYERQKADDLLQAFATPLARLHEAARRGGAARYQLRFDGSFDAFEAETMHFEGLRAGARMLALEAHVRAHRGHAHGAAQSLHALFALAKSMAREPLPVWLLVRVAMDGVAIHSLEQLMPHVAFSDEDLALLQRDLLAIDYQPGLHRAMLGQLVAGWESFRDPRRMAAASPNRWSTWLHGFTRSEDQLAFLRLMAAQIAAANQPLPAARAAMTAVDRRTQAMVFGSVGSRYRFAVTMSAMPEQQVALDAVCRGTARAGGLAAVLALRRRQLRQGDLPASLDELVPEFLPRVPADPYDGGPLRYLRRADAAVVYAVGQNERDDGGVEENPLGPDVVTTLRLAPAGEQ